MEAYENLASRKRPGESFSEVIKSLTAASTRTASALIADAADLRLDESTLDSLEIISRERETDMPRFRSLDEPA